MPEPPIFRTFSFSQTQTLYPLNTNSPSSLLAPGNHVRDGSLIPHAPLAQRTDQIDWNAIELKAYKADATTCTGLLFKPGDKEISIIKK